MGTQWLEEEKKKVKRNREYRRNSKCSICDTSLFKVPFASKLQPISLCIEHAYSIRCKAITKLNQRCKNVSIDGLAYCNTHHEGPKKVSYKTYIKSNRWKITAEAAKERVGNRCQLCNSNGVLHVHHRTYERLGNELPEDLTALCDNCHDNFHRIIGKPKDYA